MFTTSTVDRSSLHHNEHVMMCMHIDITCVDLIRWTWLCSASCKMAFLLCVHSCSIHQNPSVQSLTTGYG